MDELHRQHPDMGRTQPYYDPSFLKEVWGLFACGCIIYLVRFIVRIRAVGVRGFQGDDYFAIGVLICYTADAVTANLVYLLGTNVDYTPQQLEAFSKADQDTIELGSRMTLIAWYAYPTLVWCLKAQMLFFFNRLTFGLKQQKFVKILAIACGITYIAVFLTITLGCYPTSKNWQVVPYPGLKCTFKPQNFYVCTILNVITDAAILAIPLPLMWTLQVSVKKRIALMLLLSSGVFVISAAIIRIVMTFLANPNVLTIYAWGVRETIAGIFAVNLPVIRPIFTKRFWSRSFPHNDPKSSASQSKPPGANATIGSTHSNRLRSGALRSAFSRRGVEAYELEDEYRMDSHHRSNHSSGEKGGLKFVASSEVNEIDSASASDVGGQMHTNRSSEDLVVDRQGAERPSRSIGRRPSSPREREVDLESGAQSPPRVEVRVEQSYHSRRDPVGHGPGSSWRGEQGWTGTWPAQGYGNRTTVESRNVSRE